MQKVHWVIPCPACRKELRVKNHRLLGRRGQCPFCQHKFILEVPKASGYEAKRRRPKRDIANALPEETMTFDSDVEFPLADETAPTTDA
jgi:uncharacterized protein YbaR (Trm112 family)